MAEKILDAIIHGQSWKPGDRLPTEANLAQQFAVSRTVIREAIRMLAGRGVVVPHRGRGTRVGETGDAFRRAMALYLRGRARWHYLELHEVRVLLEVEVAGLAAARATPADMNRLEDACDRMKDALGDRDTAAILDFEFHRLLAQATQNVLFQVMLDAMADAQLEIRRDTFGPDGRSAEALASHREILKHIAANEAAGARDAMVHHLADILKYWQEHVKRSALQGDGMPRAGSTTEV